MSHEPKRQSDRFREAARELECDESEDTFDRAMKRIVKAPPMTDEEVKTSADRERPEVGPGSGKKKG